MRPLSWSAVVLGGLLVCPAAAAASQPPQPPPPAEQPLPDEPAEADDRADDEQELDEPTTEPAARRPFRGRFGGARPYSSRGPSLDLTLSAVGGWDEPVRVDELLNPEAERLYVEGPFAGASASLFYRRPHRAWPMEAFGSTFIGYFPQSEGDEWYPSTSAGVSVGRTFRLNPRTRFNVSLTEGYSTDERLFGFSGTGPSDIPQAGGSTGFDTSLRRAPSLSTSPSASLTRDFSRQSSLDVFYRYRHIYYFDREDDPLDYGNRRDQEAGARFTRKITRNLSMRAGYAYRTSDHAGPGDYRADFHDIDVGVDYGRSLSISRRTVFAFRTGSTIGVSESGSDGGLDDDPPFSDPRFFVVGGATLTHEVGRSWRLFADYTRDVDFQDGFAQPLLRDTGRVGLGGLIGYRTDVSADVTYTSGSFGFDDRNYAAWTASTQVRTALTRNLAAYAYSYYYWQEFDASVILPIGVVSDASRYGIRFGLTSWFPLWP